MRKSIFAVLFALALAVSAFAVAAPAQAYGSRPASCNTSSLCWYNGYDFVDGPGKVTGTNASLAAFSHASCPSGTWDNCVSSIWNATAYCFHLSDGYNNPASHHNLGPNDGYTNLTTQAAYNNVISSEKRGSSSSCSF